MDFWTQWGKEGADCKSRIEIYTLPCVQEGQDICIIIVPSLGQKDPLEVGTATHSSILAWETPWTEEPGGLLSIGSQTAGHHRGNLACIHIADSCCHTAKLTRHCKTIISQFFFNVCAVFCIISFSSIVSGNSVWKAVPFKFYLPEFSSDPPDTKNN